MDDSSSSSGRSKRQRVDKAAKFDKLKQLKGSKHKYEIVEEEKVYDEVDEDTYAEKVMERQEDDWIVDDDGAGYVEDGREIFDDDLDNESINKNKKQKNESRKRGRPKAEREEAQVSRPAGGNIRSMFANMPTKKRKEAAVKLEDDDILGDLIQEIDSTPKSKQKNGVRVPTQDMTSRDYLRSFSSVALKPKPVKQSLVLTPAPVHISTPRPPFKPTRRDSGNGSVPLIEDDFTEDLLLDDMDVDSDVIPVKKEMSEEKPPVIEDFDSNDGHEWFDSDAAFQQVDKQIEEIESQLTEPQVEVKKELEKVKDVIDDTEDKLLNGDLWEDMENIPSTNESVSVNVDPEHLPLVTKEDGDKVFRFFYWDAYEDMFKAPGTVYLFGKVFYPKAQKFVSCCVIMKDIERTIFLLPREEHINVSTGKSTGKDVTMKNVYDEFDGVISTKYKIKNFRSRPVAKNYAFELDDVPNMCEYLEVKYSPSQAQLPKDLSGATFSHVFGTNSSFLELLLLQRKIKGPCWLELSDCAPSHNPVSFCKYEVVGGHIRTLSVSPINEPPPPLSLVSLCLRTSLNTKSNQTEIVMASMVVHHDYRIDKQAASQSLSNDSFVAMTRPSDKVFPTDLRDFMKRPEFASLKVEKCDSERALLCFFLAKLSKLDPDVVAGHGLTGADLDVLIHRLATLKIPNWSRLGRLKRANIPPPGKARFQVEKYPMCGRLVCDVQVSAKELIRARSYDLTTLSQSVLKLKIDEERKYDMKLDLTSEEVKSHYDSGSNLFQLLKASTMAAKYTLRIMHNLNVLPLALQITNIAGNVMSRTLMGGRAERNEFLLLHAFSEKGYIVPDKQYGKKPVKDEAAELEELMGGGGGEASGPGASRKGGGGKSARKKPAYAGGLVLEPKVGFYDKLILLMDFNSLYPSIIHEYNICFTTVRKVITLSEEGEQVSAEPPPADEELGILPTEIRKLVESRRQVKKLMKGHGLTADLRLQYDIRQMALKLTANSMYGCLGFSNSRFYAKPLAALVTAKGREILTNTKDLVEKLSYEVVYGDTDSIMINTNILEYDQVFKIGNKIKSEVNKLYKHVELDIDGVFKFMLLLKKKKYAAVTITRLASGELVYTQEIKGLDIVRRDWSQLAHEAGKMVLSEILSDKDQDDRIQNILNQMTKMRHDLEGGAVPLSLLTISKQLAKAPSEYSDKKGQPHVQVALRMNAKGSRFRAGDTVHYIICEDGTNNPPTQRAYHIKEYNGSETLKLDIKYYLSQQIHPVVTRLIEPVEGTDAAQIAECLGLDPSNYKEKPKPTEDLGVGDTAILSDDERFKNCDKFAFKCVGPDCGCEISMDRPGRQTERGMEWALAKCGNAACQVSPMQYLAHIQNCLTVAMRGYITKYYKGWLICEDPSCPQRTRRLPLHFENKYPVCTKCHKNNMYREYNEKDLYTQLSFFRHMFDLSRPPYNTHQTAIEMFNAYGTLRDHVSRTLASSAYSVINLTKLFAELYPKPITVKKEVQIKSEPQDD